MHLIATAWVLVLSAFLAPGAGETSEGSLPPSPPDGSTLAVELG